MKRSCPLAIARCFLILGALLTELGAKDVRNSAKLPPEFQSDTAPKMALFVMPKYPYALLKENVKGSATVSLHLTATGKVAFSKVSSADRPEFGYALQAAADLFQYQPALKNGQPSEAMLSFRFDFKTSDSSVVSDAERAVLTLERKHPERILKARDLDHRLKPTTTRAPAFPLGEELTAEGDAVVEFIVDEKGCVELPRIVSASNPAFGYAAVQAVSGWRFEPPLSQGKPGVARVTVPFEFKRTAADGSTGQP